MELPQLRCFLAVAEELHFGRAAQRLHLTPSPVSRAVRDLEAEFGVQLFVRSYHRVELTDAGHELVGRVRGILDEIDALKPAVQQLPQGQRRLKIGASHLAPPREVDRFLAVAREAGGLETDVNFASSENLLTALRAGDVDIVVVHLPVDAPEVRTATLARYPFKLVMRADDPLADSTGLRLADIADRTLALPAYTSQPVMVSRLHHLVRAAGITSLKPMPAPDTFMLAADIRQNGTIALTADPVLGGPAQIYADPAYAVVDLLDDIHFDIGVVCKESAAERYPAISRIMRRLAENPSPPAEPAVDR